MMHRKPKNTFRKRESMSACYTKPITPTENKRLRQALLESTSLASLSEEKNPTLRLKLIKDKIHMCLVQCDWKRANDRIESKLIENKRKILLEILEFYGQRKFKSMELLRESFRLLWLNLFRALPDPDSIRTAPNDDEMDFREPSWDHLVLIYEIAFHVVTNTEIDKKTMQKQLRGKFLQSLVQLFHSLDDREPQYVKIILHAIYGRFMALRKDIRCYLSQYCYRYIYDTRCELVDSNSSIEWQGVPEILAIFCSIIQGLNVPVKQDYHMLLRNVLIPLHKTYHLDAFHEELVQCCRQFIHKDPASTCVILGGLLKFWPNVSPLKEQMFIDEMVQMLNCAQDYIEQMVCNDNASHSVDDSDDDHNAEYNANHNHNQQIQEESAAFENMFVALVKQLCKSMQSPHHQVAERALLVWKEESMKLCFDAYGERCATILYSTLKKIMDKYWLVEIRNIARNICGELHSANASMYKRRMRLMKRQESRKVQDERSKQKHREHRWNLVKQLAIVHRININK